MKRSYQKIQEDEEDEDDDYRSHISPRNTGSSATQLVGCHSVLISGTGAFLQGTFLMAIGVAKQTSEV